jgi:hypothetical protein
MELIRILDSLFQLDTILATGLNDLQGYNLSY